MKPAKKKPVPRTAPPRHLWIIESVTPDGIRIPVDGEPDRHVLFFGFAKASKMARYYREQDRIAGCDTQIQVTKYVAQEARR